MTICNKCSEFGMSFKSSYLKSPADFLEGSLYSKVWIIGLNPKVKEGEALDHSLEKLRNLNPDDHPYFRDFQKVSRKLYDNWKSENSKVGHTDLVKCGSPSFPPINPNNSKKLSGKETKKLIGNCSKYLKKQILDHKPLLLICNGSPTSQFIFQFLPPDNTSIKSAKEIGSYKSTFQDHTFTVVMTGFIGRIDDWNKRRLGHEIDSILDELNIAL